MAEATLMRVFVAGGALRREPEERWVAAPVGFVVALRARRISVRAVQRPTCLGVIELALIAVRPTHKRFAEVLDVASFAWLALVLETVKALARCDPRAEITVALEAGALIDATARAVAVVAVLVAFERAMRLRQWSRREQLRMSNTREEDEWQQEDEESDRDDNANNDDARPRSHFEKIHRKPKNHATAMCMMTLKIIKIARKR